MHNKATYSNLVELQASALEEQSHGCVYAHQVLFIKTLESNAVAQAGCCPVSETQHLPRGLWH